MKKALVTGCGGGLGRAVCALALRQGFEVYGLDCEPGESLPGLHAIPCDLTNPSAVHSACARVRVECGELDAIVHAAGVYDLDSLLEMDEQRMARIFQVNLFGVYRVNRAFVPLLRPGGRVVITSSELAPLDPLPFTGVYAVTKAALEKYAYSLRMEVGLLGISVSVLRPGAIRTGLLGVSTRALDRFCAETQLYTCNAARFRAIVNRVEARSVEPEAVARLALRALTAHRPRYVYNINRNPLLRLLNLLPDRLQTGIIRRILRPE